MRRLLFPLAVALTAVGITVLAPGAQASHSWAPADSATVHPGVQTYTEDAQCTSNFVFEDAAGAVYLGQAAHCSGTGAANETDGCDSGTHPLGTPVEIEGASKPGTMVYNSWIAMQEAGETDEETCLGNDFALVRVDPADVAKINPSVPFFGGPTSLSTSVTEGDSVYSYGNSSLRLGLTPLSPKEGVVFSNTENGWSHVVYTVTPGVPGDSGSGFLDADGRAFGVLSTLNILPEPGGNGVSNLSKALAYANAHGMSGVRLVAGTEPFAGGVIF